MNQTFASSILTFSPEEVVQIDWGKQQGQISLLRVPANNYSSPRVLLNDVGESLYLLDSSNYRIVTFNMRTKQFSHVNIGKTPADDFCVLDNGEHFYLLSSNQKKVFLYDAQGKRRKIYPLGSRFTPLSMQCNSKRGISFQATDGQFYYFNTNKDTIYLPIGDYSYSIDKETDKQGTVWIHQHEDNLTTEINTDMQNSQLQTIDIVGVDKQGDVYLTIERSNPNSESIIRFLQKYTKDGRLKAEAEIPYSFFAYTLQDLTLSTKGEVFQMVPLREHLKIIKWLESPRTTTRSMKSSTDFIDGLYSYLKSKPDDFLPSEGKTEESSGNSRGYLAPVTRKTVMEKAEAFTNFQYRVDWPNITSSEYKGGKKIVTPVNYPGTYTGVPYKWGGFNNLSSFERGLQQNKYAGDKCTKSCSGVSRGSSYAVGVDCSGFVSQVWGLSSHTGTSLLPSVSKRLPSFHDLKPGDILNKLGHVRLFSHQDNRGKFWVYEASSKDWKVNKHSYTSYQLQGEGYKPYRYENILDYTAYSSNTFPPNVGSTQTTPWYSKPTQTSSQERPFLPLPFVAYKTPSRFYIYGKRALREGSSTRYRAKIYYSDNTSNNVTYRSDWTTKKRYSFFSSGTTLRAKQVRRNEYTYVKASYRENGRLFTASVPVTIRNQSKWRSASDPRGPSAIAQNTLPFVDISYKYSPNAGQDQEQAFADDSTLYSGDYYQFIVSFWEG